jgi:hypothetical protein
MATLQAPPAASQYANADVSSSSSWRRFYERSRQQPLPQQQQQISPAAPATSIWIACMGFAFSLSLIFLVYGKYIFLQLYRPLCEQTAFCCTVCVLTSILLFAYATVYVQALYPVAA